jgi:hypothetical protein
MDTLHAAGLADSDVAAWRAARPDLDGDYAPDAEDTSGFLLPGADLLARLPAKPDRSEDEQGAATDIKAALDDVRDRFLRRHTRPLYADLTNNGTRAVRA